MSFMLSAKDFYFFFKFVLILLLTLITILMKNVNFFFSLILTYEEPCIKLFSSLNIFLSMIIENKYILIKL